MSKILSAGLALWAAQVATAGLSNCTFNFGTPYAGSTGSEIGFVTQWAGSEENYDLGSMMKACAPGGALHGVTPVLYDYIIAFTLRRDYGLQDCNVGTPSLCDSGAYYIRNPAARAHILGQVSKYAQGTANDLGTTTPVVWMMEPDYYQYAQPGSESGNPLSFAEAGTFMGEMLDSIQKYLPHAVFSMDISPWVASPSQWFGALPMNRFTYINTSGGETNAEGPPGSSRIRTSNTMTWASVHTLTGKPILADAGYGTAGASTGLDTAWDNPANINNRIADGVISIGQANPTSNWNSILTSIRSDLQALPGCSSEIFFPRPAMTVKAAPDLYFDVLGRRWQRLFAPDLPRLTLPAR